MTLPLVKVADHDVQFNFDEIAKRIVDTGGRQIKLRFGLGAAITYAFTASATSAAATVTHGMGSTPQAVAILQFGGPVAGFSPTVTALSSTTFTTQASLAGAVTGNIFAFWLAIG